jgi:hypothetical protein
MKIIMDSKEMTSLVKKSFPPEMIPHDHVITDVKVTGYPEKEYTIIIEKKEPTND